MTAARVDPEMSVKEDSPATAHLLQLGRSDRRGDRLETHMEHGIETSQVWHQMHERLLAYIQRRVATIHDAEDILQDVFVRIHANLHRLKDTQSITAWIYRIARNAVTDYRRKQATATKALAGLAEEGDEPGEAAGEETTGEFARCLEPLLDELPEPYRQAVAMTELNGVSQKDAAGKLGVSVSGMKARVQRGRRKLKDAVLDCCSVELDRRGGLADFQRRDGSDCKGCDCG